MLRWVNVLYSYLVGGLLLEGLTPEIEEEKLNLCGAKGWELVAVREATIKGHTYRMFYFKRAGSSAQTDSRFNPKIFDFAN
jgi:hypothetical protein